MTETLFIAATPGIEPELLREARRLGEARLVPGGVSLQGSAGLHRRANLGLRCATRVWLELGRLRASNLAELRRAIRALDLSPFIRPGAPLQIETITRGGLSTADLRAAGREFKRGSLRLRSEGNAVFVSIDTSGELLSRRGYRQEGSRAPLSESLAAGLLAIAAYEPEQPVWDPLCGSGTIVIEAALLARKIAPGLHRSFDFERFPSHDVAAFAREKAEARGLARAPAPIFASDLNAGALGTARRNATRAGVLEDLKLFRHDATQPYPQLPPGTLALANLPYGKRVGGDLDLPKLYRRVAEAARRSGAARAAFLAADPSAQEWLGLETAEVHRVDNGGLSCRLLVAQLS